MTPFIRTVQDLVTRTALTMSVVVLTTAFTAAQQPVAPAQPAPAARPAPAAQPAPPATPPPAAQPAPRATPPPAARPAPRPLPSRNVKLEVSVIAVGGSVTGAARVLTVITAEGRHARFRRQGQEFFNLDATSTIVNDRQVLVDFNLNARAGDGPGTKEAPAIPELSAALGHEGSVLLTPGVKQRVTQLGDRVDRPSFHVEMLVEIVK